MAAVEFYLQELCLQESLISQEPVKSVSTRRNICCRYFHSLLKTGYNVHTHSVIYNKVLLFEGWEGGNEDPQSTKGGMH